MGEGNLKDVGREVGEKEQERLLVIGRRNFRSPLRRRQESLLATLPPSSTHRTVWGQMGFLGKFRRVGGIVRSIPKVVEAL